MQEKKQKNKGIDLNFLKTIEQELQSEIGVEQDLSVAQEEQSDHSQRKSKKSQSETDRRSQTNSFIKSRTKYSKLEEPQSAQELKERVELLEKIMQSAKIEKYPEQKQFYAQEMEKYTKSRKEISQEEKQRIIKQLKKEEKTYKRMKSPQSLEDAESRLQDVVEILKLIKGVKKDAKKYYYYFKEKKLDLEERIEFLEKKKISDQKILKLRMKHEQYVKRLKIYRDPENEKEIEDRIDQIQKYLSKVPSDCPELEDISGYYRDEIKKWKREDARLKKKEKEAEQEISKSGLNLVLLLKLNKIKAKFREQNQPKDRKKVLERLEELDQFGEQIPEGNGLFDELLEFYVEKHKKYQKRLKSFSWKENKNSKGWKDQAKGKYKKIMLTKNYKTQKLDSEEDVDSSENTREKEISKMHQSPSGTESSESQPTQQKSKSGKGKQKKKNKKTKRNPGFTLHQESKEGPKQTPHTQRHKFVLTSSSEEKSAREVDEDKEEEGENKVNALIESEEDDVAQQIRKTVLIQKEESKVAQYDIMLQEYSEQLSCEKCYRKYQRWKFKTCEEECEIKICKKCAGQIYAIEKERECIGCFETIREDELQFLKSIK